MTRPFLGFVQYAGRRIAEAAQSQPLRKNVVGLGVTGRQVWPADAATWVIGRPP